MLKKNIKINLFLIGASKCGTTYLYNILKSHPKICMSNIKEPQFFFDIKYEKELEKLNFLYPHYNFQNYIGDASPIYSETIQFPEIPKRLFDYNNDAKIIYIVREPFARLKSTFIQAYSTGHWINQKKQFIIFWNYRQWINYWR